MITRSDKPALLGRSAVKTLRPVVLAMLIAIALPMSFAFGADAPATAPDDIQELRKQTEELKQRLSQLEERIKTSETAQKAADTKQAERDKALRLDGYLQLRYRTDNAQTGLDEFFVRRAYLNFRTPVTDNLSARVEMMMSGKVTGGAPGSKIELRSVYADYAKGPSRIRMGQAVLPLSFELISSAAALYSGERAVMYDVLFPGQVDMGLQYKWTAGPGKPAVEVGLVNGTGQNKDDDNSGKDAFASLTYPFGKSNTILSYYNGTKGVGSAETDRNTLGAGYTYDGKKITFAAEGLVGENAGADVAGWYSQVGYKLPVKGTVFARYDVYDQNTDADDDAIKRTTVGWFWDFQKNNRVTLVYEFRKPQAGFAENNKYNGNLGYAQWQVKF